MFQRLFAIFAFAVSLMAGAQAQEPQVQLQRIRLSAGMYQIDAQVAQTPQERQFGLMFRKEMPQTEGMIFVFEEPATQCFWMKAISLREHYRSLQGFVSQRYSPYILH